MKYRAGDKIRFIREPRNFFGDICSKIGWENLVLEIEGAAGDYLDGKDFDAYYIEGDDWGWVRSDDIELVKRELKFKVGDKVRFTKCSKEFGNWQNVEITEVRETGSGLRDYTGVDPKSGHGAFEEEDLELIEEKVEKIYGEFETTHCAAYKITESRYDDPNEVHLKIKKCWGWAPSDLRELADHLNRVADRIEE